MRALIRAWIVCVGVACTSVALAAPKRPAPAAPKVSAKAQLKAAVAAHAGGEYQQALQLIEQGLAVAPNHLELLGLKGTVLLELRDYPGALAAYEAYLKAKPTGENRRQATKIVDKLLAVKSTSLEITLAGGSADVYLDSKTQGLFCHAAPSCNQPVLPDQYKVIVERPGFKRWTGPVTVESGKLTKLAVTLIEEPSQLTVRVTPPEASVTVDGAAHDAARPVPAGPHRIVVSLAGHADEQREVEARLGKPIELEIALAPLVPIRVEPPNAELRLGDRAPTIKDGTIGIPPGAHVLVARAPGFQDLRIEVPAERPADYKLVVELARIPPPPPPVPDEPGRFTGRRKLALVAGGAGVVAAGVGVVLGLQAGKLEDDAYALCPSPSIPCRDALEANELNRSGRSRALQANIAFGVAGGAAIAAAVLWLTGAPESRVAVTPRVGSVAGLDLAVRF